MLEGIGKLIELAIAHADGVTDLTPPASRSLYLEQNPDSGVTIDPEIRRDRQQSLDRCLGTGVFRYPGFQFANALGEGIDVERWRQGPLPLLGV